MFCVAHTIQRESKRQMLQIKHTEATYRFMVGDDSHWSMYTSIWWYLRVLPVLHRPEVEDIGVNTIQKNMPYA